MPPLSIRGFFIHNTDYGSTYQIHSNIHISIEIKCGCTFVQPSKTTKDFVINPTKYPPHSILFITMNRYGFPFLDYISFFDLLYNSNIVLFVSTQILSIIYYLCSKPGRKMAEVETFKVKRSTRISEVLLEPQTVSIFKHQILITFNNFVLLLFIQVEPELSRELTISFLLQV